MNKYIKMTAGSLLAAALMVGCNMNDGMNGDNNGALENPMNDNRDNNAIDNNNNRVDDDWGMDGYRNNDRNYDPNRDNNGMRNDNNREDVIEDNVDREDRDRIDE